MRAVVITGAKKSGKTALLGLVAEALERQGKRVAVIKYSSHALEQGNTDAFWFMRENRIVVNVSPEETAVLWPERLDFADIVAHVRADVLLLEGGDAPTSVPRIVCLREDAAENAGVLEECEGCEVLAVSGGEAASLSCPRFLEAEPSSAEKIAALILEKGAEV